MIGVQSKIFNLIADKSWSKEELNTFCLNYEREIGKLAVANYIEYQEIKKSDEQRELAEKRKKLLKEVLESLTDTETKFYELKNQLKDA